MIKSAMRLLDNFKKLVVFAILMLILSVPAGVLAIPSADLLYNETDLGGGWWQYDYTVYNTSDPVGDAGFDLYDVFISFDSSATYVPLSLPGGWDGFDGMGFAEWFSLNPGAPPVGTDIDPGGFLGGFSFQIDYEAGNLSFDVYLTNPLDPINPVLYSETTAPATLPAPVPEPETIALLGIGLMLLFGYKGWVVRKARRETHNESI